MTRKNRLEPGLAPAVDSDFILYWMDVSSIGAGKTIWRLCIWPENDAVWSAIKKMAKVTKTDLESGLFVPRSNRQAFRIADALGKMGFIPEEGGHI